MRSLKETTTSTLTFIFSTDLGFQVFRVDILVGLLILRRAALPTTEAAAAATAAACNEAAAYHQWLEKRERPTIQPHKASSTHGARLPRPRVPAAGRHAAQGFIGWTPHLP